VLQSEEEGSIREAGRVYTEAEAMRLLEEGENDGEDQTPPPLPRDPPPTPRNPTVIVMQEVTTDTERMEDEDTAPSDKHGGNTVEEGPILPSGTPSDKAEAIAAATAASNNTKVTGAEIFGSGSSDPPTKGKNVVIVEEKDKHARKKKKKAMVTSSSSSSSSSSSASSSSSSDTDSSSESAAGKSDKETDRGYEREREDDTDDRGSVLIREAAHSNLPPLYYTVKKARDSSMAPRVLGGGTSTRMEMFRDLSSDPRHTMATHRHCDDTKRNIGTSFDPKTMTCYTCSEHHPILERGGGVKPAWDHTQVLCPDRSMFSFCIAFSGGRGLPGDCKA
jgi:hypothetical protein